MRRSSRRILTFLLLCVLVFLTIVYLFVPFSLRGDPPDRYFTSPHFAVAPDWSVPISRKPEHVPPLSTRGRHIVDKHGKHVQLVSINWYGASDINFVPSGLGVQHRNNISDLIRRMGFNSVRLPYSDEMVRDNPVVDEKFIAANPDLAGKSALEIFHAVVKSMTDYGLFVIPNDHITQATWCCGANLCDGQWSNEWLWPFCRVRQSEKQWIENWKKVMRPLANNRLVVGADLRNEVRAPWGTLSWRTWAAAAERCAEELLDINPEWLMIVEGLSSANDLSGVRTRPVELSVENKVVYSSHVYAWSGWGERNPYSTSKYQKFAETMSNNWAYLIEQDIAPVWIGEFGTADYPSAGDRNYWKHLMRFMRNIPEPSWALWALNSNKPLNHEPESYGIVHETWSSVRWDYRLQDLSKIGLNSTGLLKPVV